MAESRRQKISRRATRLVASRLGLRSLCAWLHDAHGSRLRRRSTHVGAGWRESASKYSTWLALGLGSGLGFGFGFGFGFGLGLEG